MKKSKFLKPASTPEEVPEQVPLVFAATVFSKSLAFGFRHEGFFNAMIEGTDQEMILLCNRDVTMSRPRDITVYSFPDLNSGQTLYHCIGGEVMGTTIAPSSNYGATITQDVKDKLSAAGAGFVELPYMEHQAVSTQSVPLPDMPGSKTQIALKAKNAEDLMQAGLQILSFRETFSELRDYDFSDKSAREKGYTTLNQYLGALVREGKIIWENNERGIKPSPAFAQQLSVELKALSTDEKADNKAKLDASNRKKPQKPKM
jgi:hypothetical protein